MNGARVDRTVPRWAAGLVAVMSRDRPMVVTRALLADYLAEVGADRPVGRTARDLQQLGWLATLHIKGVWAFVPAGESHQTDPYVDLRAWRVRDHDAIFALAGEAAAWHLGYLPRQFAGSTAVWIPVGTRIPHGLRPYVSVTRLGWTRDLASKLGPTKQFLRGRDLDLTGWAGGLPALGPDALLVQLASRPSSFRTWADLITQLELLIADCDLDRVVDLMSGFSASAWQRAAYLFDRGGATGTAERLLAQRPEESMPVAQFGDGPTASWSSKFSVNDRLIAPLQRQLGKS